MYRSTPTGYYRETVCHIHNGLRYSPPPALFCQTTVPFSQHQVPLSITHGIIQWRCMISRPWTNIIMITIRATHARRIQNVTTLSSMSRSIMVPSASATSSISRAAVTSLAAFPSAVTIVNVAVRSRRRRSSIICHFFIHSLLCAREYNMIHRSGRREIWDDVAKIVFVQE